MHKDFIFYSSLVNTGFIHQINNRILLHFTYQLQNLSPTATVGERIRYYRNQKGLRIVDLAARVGMSRNALMSYEAGETDPPLECLNKLATIFSVEKDKLNDDYYAFLVHPYGRMIFKKRKEMGLTQKDFGALLGVGRRTIEKWKAGKHLVSREIFSELIIYLPE